MSGISKYVSSVFRYVLEGNPEPKRVLVLGLDAAGKTTFLYKHRSYGMGPFFRYPDIETTIPTIGFNVETTESKKYQMMCWDIGGCDKLRPLWRHYMRDCGGIILFVDSNDPDRFPDAINEMDMFLQEVELVGLPMLVVANKWDLPRHRSLSEIIDGLRLNQLSGRSCRIVPACMTTGDGMGAINAWLMRAARGDRMVGSTDASLPPEVSVVYTNPSTGSAITPAPETASAFAASTELAAIERARQQTEREERRRVAEEWTAKELGPEDELLEQLHTCELDLWDHYTHVRIAWVLLNRHGIQEGYGEVAEALQHYIANSSRTDGKSFHPTMTRFWCHMIAYCIHWLSREAPGAGGLQESQRSFRVFISALCSAPDAPALWDKTLFKRYYSAPTMFGPEARAQVVRPDLLGLPDILLVFNPVLVADAAREEQFLGESEYWRAIDYHVAD